MLLYLCLFSGVESITNYSKYTTQNSVESANSRPTQTLLNKKFTNFGKFNITF